MHFCIRAARLWSLTLPGTAAKLGVVHITRDRMYASLPVC